MHSALFSLGPLTARGYGLMMAIGFALGLLSLVWLGRREGRDLTFCSDLLFFSMLSGIFGARVLYVAMNWDYFSLHPLLIVRIDQGGLVFYGGFIAAALALVGFARRRREPVLPLFDFVATALPLGHAFGRIGCFLNGCCFGRPWTGVLAVRFPADSPPWQYQMETGRILRAARDSLSVHPVQLYEAAFNFLLYALLVWHYRRRRRAGSTTALYLLAYSLGRYAMETFRGDDRLHWWGLSVSQHVSIGVFLMGVLALAWTHRTTGPDTAPPPPRTPASGSTAG